MFKSLNSNLACRHLWKQQSNKKVAATYLTNQMSKCLPQWWFIAFNVETTFYKMFRKNVASRNFSGLTIGRLINWQTTDKITCWQTDERLTDTEQTFRLSAKERLSDVNDQAYKDTKYWQTQERDLQTYRDRTDSRVKD